MTGVATGGTKKRGKKFVIGEAHRGGRGKRRCGEGNFRRGKGEAESVGRVRVSGRV